MGYAAFLVIFFLNGQSHFDGGMFSSLEECQEKLKEIPAVIAEFNGSAENPVKITHYQTGCVAMKKAPQGKAV
jgi:hypothetical protein